MDTSYESDGKSSKVNNPEFKVNALNFNKFMIFNQISECRTQKIKDMIRQKK